MSVRISNSNRERFGQQRVALLVKKEILKLIKTNALLSASVCTFVGEGACGCGCRLVGG